MLYLVYNVPFGPLALNNNEKKIVFDVYIGKRFFKILLLFVHHKFSGHCVYLIQPLVEGVLAID